MFGVLALFAGTVGAQTVVYSDNFDGLAGSSLVGTSPDVRPGAEVWGGTTSYKADGSFQSGGVYLPLTLAAGNVYTLAATMEATSASDWIALGFISGSPSLDHGRFADAPGFDWFLMHPDSRLQYFTGQSFAGEITASTSPQNKLMDFAITIDATDATPANWTISGSVTYDGHTYLPWPESGGEPLNAGITSLGQITGIGFGSQGETGFIDSFSLTVTSAVPEPSTYATFAGGIALLGALIHRRRKAAGFQPAKAVTGENFSVSPEA